MQDQTYTYQFHPSVQAKLALGRSVLWGVVELLALLRARWS